MFKLIKMAWRNMWRNWRRTIIALIAIVLVQGQSASGLGSVFGGSDIYRTRRGMEKTLFNATFMLAGLFLLLSLLTVMVE